jgi:hypothetical protein
MLREKLPSGNKNLPGRNTQMKRNRAILAVTTVAALTLAGQAFARGGSFGGGAGSASMAGTRQGVSAMSGAGGSGMAATVGSHHGMQSGNMSGVGAQQGPMHGTGAPGTMPTTTMGGSGHQQGPMHGTGSSTTTN